MHGSAAHVAACSSLMAIGAVDECCSELMRGRIYGIAWVCCEEYEQPGCMVPWEQAQKNGEGHEQEGSTVRKESSLHTSTKFYGLEQSLNTSLTTCQASHGDPLMRFNSPAPPVSKFTPS